MLTSLRRALRGYVFTIAGIAIGVAGIVALRAPAERIARFLPGGGRFLLRPNSGAGGGGGVGGRGPRPRPPPPGAPEGTRHAPGAAVGWRDGEDPDVVARRIRDQVAGVNVQIPSELSSLLRQSTAFFSALLVGIGLLAFVIGGLSLANTVAAAVFERIRDFGVKRALGATDWQLGREILAEALAVTLSGGALGVLLAMVLGLAIDGWARRSGQQLFLFSPRLLGGALVFSVLLGAAAAAYAALRIVRLSPAEAIRRGSAA